QLNFTVIQPTCAHLFLQFQIIQLHPTLCKLLLSCSFLLRPEHSAQLSTPAFFGIKSANMRNDIKRARRGGSPHSVEPSKVVFVRGILSNTSEREVQRVFEQYGDVKCVFLIPKQHQALVEFATLSEAEQLIRRAESGELVHIRDQPVGIGFSKQARITDPNKLYLSHDPTRILLFTLFHIEVQIDCETFRQICGRYGRLMRVCLTKNGIDTQAIVEFSRVEEAAEAKPNLNGADIYENCNTLRVEYVTEMAYDVLARDPRSVLDEWPVRNQQRELPLPTPGGAAAHRSRDRSRSRSRDRYGPAPSRRPRRSRSPIPSSGGGGGGGGGSGSRDVVSNLIGLASQLSDIRVPGLDTRGIMQYLQAAAAAAAVSEHQGGGGDSRSGRRSRSRDRAGDYHRASSSGGGGRQQSGSSSGCILFLCGLSDRMNCDRLFNLLCMYGNVRLVKFFASNTNQAMVEMSDRASADMCVRFLHNRTVLGRRIVVDYARQDFLKNTENLTNLPDGTPSVKDFFARERSLNRFLTPEKARKNHPMEPCTTVYFWGVPPDSNEQDLCNVLENLDAPRPHDVSFFNNQGIRSGLMMFDNVRDALDAICLANHAEITVGGRTCMLKLTFSESRRRGPDAAGDRNGGGGGGGRGGRPRGGGRRP
uniref:RRM domain-containing protein n=1 Tax=Macrostomum lignano TaxID=282301 RepID=A0A1I8GX90_9PLAT